MELHIRLDENHSEKIRLLQKELHLPPETLVQQAIDLLYQQQHPVAEAFEILQASGFIGCMQGPGDLSENYKSVIDLGDKL